MSPETFFGRLALGIDGPGLTPREREGIHAILGATDGWPDAWRAYALATAWHETAHTLQPVMEAGGTAYLRRRYDREGLNPRLARTLGNIHDGDGARFAGRGYVQITGRGAYRKLGKRLSLPLEDDPDLALQRPIAARILAAGMAEGLFTGKRLADYFTDGQANPVGARRIVNGLDRAAEIAGYYDHFLAALR